MTSALIGALRIDLSMQTAAFEKGVTEAQKRLKSLDRSMSRIGRKLERTGKAMSVAITAPLAAIGVASTKLAVDVEEMESAFNIAFGNSAKAVKEWAVETGDAMGRATHTLQADALRFQNLLGNTLDPAKAVEMSKQLAVLTQDLASFYNLGDGEAAQKLFSGLVGESEPLRQLGVQVSAAAVDAKALEMGFQKVNGQFLESEKIQARLAIIMEETANAQGDVIRTGDGAANQLRRMKDEFSEIQVELGKRLIPALTKLVGFINQGIDRFKAMSPETQNMIVKIGGLAAAIGPLLIGLGALASSFTAVIAAAGPLAVVTGAVLALKAAFDLIAPFYENLRLSNEALNAVMNQGVNVRRQLQAATMDNIEAVKASAEASIAEAEASLAASDAKREQALTAARTAQILRGVSPVMNTLYTKYITDAARAAQNSNMLRESIEKTKKSLAGANTRLGITPAATSELSPVAPAATARELTDKEKKAAAARKLKRARYELAQATRAEREEEQRLQDIAQKTKGHRDAARAAIDEVKANHELAAAYRISAEEGRLVAQVQALMQSGYQGTSEQARKLAQEQIAASDALAKSRDAALETGDKMKDAFDRGAKAFTGLINAIKSGDIGSILQQGIGFLNQLFGKGGSTSGGGVLSKFAGFFDEGGRIPAGKVGIAGEFGPELVRGPASVTSRMQTPKALQALAGKAGGSSRIQIVPSKYFDVVVDERSAAQAVPIAQAASSSTVAKAGRNTVRRQSRQL
jgi:hypothetical protein